MYGYGRRHHANDMTWSLDEDVARENRLMSMEEQWKMIFNEQTRAPIYSVEHYINYLRRFVEGKPLQSERIGGAKRPKDGISPLSYFLRRLKLDLRLSYDSFLVEFNKPPNGGVKLLFSLLKQLQTGSSPGSSANQKHATISSRYSTCSKLEDYKRNLTDEHDCLLCIKFCLRLQPVLHELVNDPDGLQTLVWGLLSSHVKSRITSIEILTLALMAVSGFERVFEAFTYMRLKLGESVRFKLLVSMLNSRGSANILFQITCMRFLNTLLNSAPSVDLRVYLQEEIRMAGFELNVIEQNARGDGLEYDDLKREVEEWTTRYINVQSLLKKLKNVCQSPRNGHYPYPEGQALNCTVMDDQTHDSRHQRAPKLNYDPLQPREYSHPTRSSGTPTQSNSSQSSHANRRSQSNRSRPRVGVMATEERFSLSELENGLRTMRRRDEVTGSRRKLYVPNVSYSLPEIEKFIDDFDMYALPGDSSDLLVNVLRSLYEKTHMYSSNSNLPFLVALDQLATQLSTLDQCEDKLKLIGFMSHYTERIKELHEKIDCISTASFTLNNRPKVKQMFEIIVEFGNRLHRVQSSNDQDTFGLSSFDSLSKTDVSSTARCETLLDYIVTEVTQHFVEIGDWNKQLNIAVPDTVTLTVIDKQINYLKEGISILQSEMKQREHIHSIRDFLSSAPRQLREVEEDYQKMLSAYRQVCRTFQVEADDWEPWQLFGAIAKFAEDYERSSQKIKQATDGHCDFKAEKLLSSTDVSVRNGLDVNDNIRTSLQDLSTEVVDQKSIEFSDEEEVSIEQYTWLGSYKSKFSSEPVINFNDSFTTSRMGRELSRTRENVDENWLLSPCSSLPTMLSAVSTRRCDDDVTNSRGIHQKPVEGVDVYYDEIEHETYVYPLTERHGEPDGAVSPNSSHCNGVLPTNSSKFSGQAMSPDGSFGIGAVSTNQCNTLAAESITSPSGDALPTDSSKSKSRAASVVKNKRTDSQRSYNDELTEILLDFEKTLYANDNVIKPNPISSHATVLRGPITFV
ncbi:uncharacterized protein LOC121380098 isoform X2 [Gigantopelta aegis]|uniref:uncharacterized protein LOC121380098 isoform X2 n=1 Tax=Gigantopelta aegis TaxID=1735272 RepID=UPI001B8892B5|nr:uncharacterized protein LOC121380098 isoform X2 [Gigantopelta aegis]